MVCEFKKKSHSFRIFPKANIHMYRFTYLLWHRFIFSFVHRVRDLQYGHVSAKSMPFPLRKNRILLKVKSSKIAGQKGTEMDGWSCGA